MNASVLGFYIREFDKCISNEGTLSVLEDLIKTASRERDMLLKRLNRHTEMSGIEWAKEYHDHQESLKKL